jgi:hypothetical protein
MNLREFLDALPSIKEWAEKHGLNPNLLTQYAPKTGQPTKRPGPLMAIKISKATGCLVPLAQLRPDLWG